MDNINLIIILSTYRKMDRTFHGNQSSTSTLVKIPLTHQVLGYVQNLQETIYKNEGLLGSPS